MLGIIIAGLALYFIYKFIVEFVLPIVRTTSAVKRKMQQMQQPSYNEASGDRTTVSNTTSSNPSQKSSLGKKGDYIDFEEVKDPR